MTMAQQVLHTLGIDSNGATRRLERARRRLGKRADHVRRLARQRMPEVNDISYVWLGMAFLGAAVAVAFAREAFSARGGRRVRDVMVRDVLTVDATATLVEVAQRMREANIGVLPVVENGRLRGMITDRDLVVRGMARGMDAAQTPVRYIATEELAAARQDWSVEDAMAVMSECQVGRLPVVDDDQRVVGIVTLSSLALRSRGQREALETAQEVSRRSARSA